MGKKEYVQALTMFKYPTYCKYVQGNLTKHTCTTYFPLYLIVFALWSTQCDTGDSLSVAQIAFIQDVGRLPLKRHFGR